MKNLLQDLIDAKINLASKQRLFQKFLFSNFPTLLQVSVGEIIKSLNSELDVALSFCLRKKSARINIPTKKTWRDDGVYLTYNPGLHCSYSRCADVELLDSDTKLEDRDLIHEDKKKTKLSILVGHPDVNQEKLEKFYELLECGLFWEKNMQKFYSTDLQHDNKGNKEATFKGFKIGFRNNSAPRIFPDEKLFKELSEEDLDDLYKYSPQYSESDFLFLKGEIKKHRYYDDDKNQICQIGGELPRDKVANVRLLDLVLENTDLLLINLSVLEKEKLDLIRKAEDLLKEIKTFTTPYRVMKSLLKK